MTTSAIVLSIVGGIIWGTFAGFAQFHWIYISSKKKIDKGLKPFGNPLRMLASAAALFLPAFINIYVFLATFGGFALGFALWWIWFRIKLSSGGKDA